MRLARGTFGGQRALLIGPEYVGVLKQYGKLAMTIRVGDAETNTVMVDVPKQ